MYKWIETEQSHDSKLPFMPVRSFFITDVPCSVSRGEHAHQLSKEI